jgi:hypothetical protein
VRSHLRDPVSMVNSFSISAAASPFTALPEWLLLVSGARVCSFGFGYPPSRCISQDRSGQRTPAEVEWSPGRTGICLTHRPAPPETFNDMHNPNWSSAQKAAARRAFERALGSELMSVNGNSITMLCVRISPGLSVVVRSKRTQTS